MSWATFTAGWTCSTNCSQQIHRDIDGRQPEEALIVFLGDLVDRGPDSARVVERLRSYRRDGVRPVFLLGNHEEVLLRIAAGEARLIPSWLRFGGAQCLKSYGGDPMTIAIKGDEAAVDGGPRRSAERASRVPAELCRHLPLRRLSVRSCRNPPGSRARPADPARLELDSRAVPDDDTDHGFVVVHGHTIRARDRASGPTASGSTPALIRTGVLTALGNRRSGAMATRYPPVPGCCCFGNALIWSDFGG